MKIFLKTISTLLAVLFVFGCMTFLPISAADTKAEEEAEPTAADIDYTTEIFNTPEDALKWMTPYMENDNFIFYINEYTAVFAVVNKVTGQIVFSNPYDVPSAVGKTATAIKNQVLSQIHVKYLDNGLPKELYSYSDAVLNKQVKIKKIKSGVRVEYVIGNESTRKLVPRLISEERYIEMIDTPLSAAIGTTHNYDRFSAFYIKCDLSATHSKKEAQALLDRYPICEEKVVRALSTDITTNELNFAEELIKGYCPDYTFDEMDRDHEECMYEAENELSPVFKLALEYSLNNDGITVRQPTNGLRYNTTLYQVEDIYVLPYMGCGNSYNDGYTMLPDGSGALFTFKDLAGDTPYRRARKIYGNDYAYHELDGTYQKAYRLPVYGVKSDNLIYSFSITMLVEDEEGIETQVETEYCVSATQKLTKKDIEAKLDIFRDMVAQKTLAPLVEQEADAFLATFGLKVLNDGKADRTLIDTKKVLEVSEVQEKVDSTGYFAIIEEGESLCTLATYHGGRTSDYHMIQLSFNPRPNDKYDISDAISVSGAGMRTVVSDRKYTGNLKIRYVMLSDPDISEETGFNENAAYYRADYVGMADAYADYLVAQGILSPLSQNDLTADIPLYIESFGALEVTEQILSFPVDVMKPLTKFEDIKTMYDELAEAGVKNINFKLTGFANGGMYSTVPSKLKWEKALGGKSGLISLLEYAQSVNEKGDTNLSLYPDFDFLYRTESSLFDGVKLKRDAIKTIDNRYTSKRYYSATQRKWSGYFQLALSPAAIDRFYTKLMDNYQEYLKYNAMGISLATMGTDLNTDFDEDEPYNREDNKKFMRQALESLSSMEGLKGVMSEGGNAYTLKYIDHLLNVEVDSSRFIQASYSIPFSGLVLHGYIQFAGTPLNMEGDVNYAFLKAIENGASIYFILSYRNTSELKDDFMLSKYYSVNYSIWKEDVIEYYNRLNSVMKDVQTKTIIDHQFIEGVRILDVSEIESYVKETMEANAEIEASYEETTRMENIIAIAEARAAAKNAVATMEETEETLTKNASSLKTAITDIQKLVKDCTKAKSTYDTKAKDPKVSSAALKAYLKSYNSAVNSVRDAAVEKIQVALDAQHAYDEMLKLYETAAAAMTLLQEAGAADELIQSANDSAKAAESYLDVIKGIANECSSYVDSIYEAAELYADKESIDKLLNDYSEEEEEEEETDEETDSAFSADRGHIVAVTYGDRNGKTETPYKTFILNYNNYAVTVTYEVGDVEKVYTIPAGEFVVITY